MTKLTTTERKDLPASDFVLKKARKFPIPDASHARNALARASQSGSPSIESAVRQEVKRRFPGIK